MRILRITEGLRTLAAERDATWGCTPYHEGAHGQECLSDSRHYHIRNALEPCRLILICF